MAPKRRSASAPAQKRSAHTNTPTPSSAAGQHQRLVAGAGQVGEDAPPSLTTVTPAGALARP